MKKLFTSESVTEGHPDKICDQISDAILDAYLEKDKNSRVACEVTITEGFVLIMGEVTSKAKIDIESIARKTIKKIGYDKDEYGFNANACEIVIKTKSQSEDIALGVDNSLESKEGFLIDEIGAGDQGIMFGYACCETKEYMPLPIVLAHKLAKRLDEVRHNKILDYLRPDGKTQVTLEYEDDLIIRADTIIVSAQHDDTIELKQLRNDIIKYVIKGVIPNELIDQQTKILVNPTGRFVIGGPLGDTGLTGRKIIVDTYGGYARHGGGAFSGKDATKVDRSATYYARYIAKNIVASGIAKKCEIQLSYAIGVARPTSIFVDTFNTGKHSDSYISDLVTSIWSLTPQKIIKELNLDKPIFKNLASYGHMGREDLNVAWEKIDKIDAIKKYINNN